MKNKIYKIRVYIYIQPLAYDSDANNADEREGGLVSDLHLNLFNAH